MQNPRLASRYAKSLMDIAIEQGKLDAIYQDMQGINEICANSSDFVSMMKSPVINSDLKVKTIKALIESKVDHVTISFVNLIIQKGRDFFLPEIATAFISLYKTHNKINDVVLTTSEPLDDVTKASLQAQIAAQFQGMTIDLTTKVDPKLIGGFVLESNNNLFDASILRDLQDIKKQFLKNEYIPDIR